MVVDPHIHARDFQENRKETIDHVLHAARRAGVDGVFAMPNTRPPLTSRNLVREYLRIADKASSKVFFGVYMGLTKDVEQVRRAIEVYREYHPRVVGFKLYAGRSTNPEISVTENSGLRRIFSVLAKEGYDGIVAVHAEKETEMDETLFNSKNPITHAILARPYRAEVESIRDILKITEETGYKGKLDIKHISTPAGVQLVDEARERGQNVCCMVCPHHMMYNWNIMKSPNGWIWKMNPPLRVPGTPEKMLELLRDGKIYGVETDHAPHLLRDKEPPTCASGLAAVHAWPLFLEFLRRNNFTEEKIDWITHGAAVERHEVDIDNSRRKGEYVSSEYETNPWKPLEEQLGFGKT